MSKDILPQKYGRLWPIEKVDDPRSHHTYWRCACECGRTIVTRAAYLRNGQSKSCGCLRTEKAELVNARRFRNLEARTFGRLRVIEMERKVGNVFYWKTRCQCGQLFIANGSKLKDGTTRSCGCLKSELLSRANKKRMKSQPRLINGQFAAIDAALKENV